MDSTPNLEGLTRWTTQLRALSADDWARVAGSLAEQRGDSIRALWRRAAHRRLWVTPFTPYFQPVVQVALAAGELVREFSASPFQPSSVENLRYVGEKTKSALYGTLADAVEVAKQALPDDVIVHEATLVAAHAIAHRPPRDAAAFAEAYAPFASVIPLEPVGSPNA